MATDATVGTGFVVLGGLVAAAGFGITFTGVVRRVALTHRATQPISDDVPEHARKAGTPTMGGIGIVAAILAAYALAHLVMWQPPSPTGLILVGLVLACAAVGLLDDLTKVRSGKNKGLSARAKAGLLTGVGVAFGVALENAGLTARLSASLYGLGAVRLGGLALVAWALVLVLATTNAVNLTDGMDGLAAGASTIVSCAFAAISVWMAFHPAYGIADAADIGLLAGVSAGACVGFLVWNAPPAQIFMGDTGSLALGGALAGFAVVTGSGLMLPFLGVLFVVEAASVIVLVLSYRTSGRMPFRAPIHHHLERFGWSEPVVVRRLLFLSALGVVVALALMTADWAVGSGLVALS